MKWRIFFIAFSFCIAWSVQSSAPALAQCLPGLPCVVPLTPNNPNSATDGPNRSGAHNVNKSESEACDADFMNQIHARAFLEASRENILSEVTIRKPDSVLEYTCFDQALQDSATYAGPIFTESTRWQDTSVQNLGGSGSMLGGFLGSIVSGVAGSIIGPIADTLSEVQDAMGVTLDIPDSVIAAMEEAGLSTTSEVFEYLEANVPDAAAQIADYAQSVAGEVNVTNAIANAANSALDSAIESARQEAQQAILSGVNSVSQELVGTTVNSAISAAESAIGLASSLTSEVDKAVSNAAGAVAQRQRAITQAQNALAEAQASLIPVDVDTLAALEARIDMAEAGLAAAQQTAANIATQAQALQEEVNLIAGNAQALADNVTDLADTTTDAIAQVADGAAQISSAVAQAQELGGQLSELATEAGAVVGEFASQAEALFAAGSDVLDVLGNLSSILPESIGNLLSLGGIEGSAEIALDSFMGTAKLDQSLQTLIFSTLSSYADTNFAHPLLFFGQQDNPETSDNENATLANSLSETELGCAFMNDVYFLARCNQFGLDEPFMTFAQLASMDPRSLPESCGGTSITQELIQVANNTGYAHAAFDPLKSFIEYRDSAQCAEPVPTGLKVAKGTINVDSSGNTNLTSMTVMDDVICINPGCYFNGTQCVVGP